MKIRLTEKQYKLIKEQEVKIPNDPLLGSIDGHKEKETAFLNNIQYVFDVAGFVPVYGDLIDVINSIIYFIRGKNLEGFLSIIAIIPVVGSLIALPFKVLFKLIPQSAIKKIVNFIHTGNGKQAAQTLIKIGKEKAPNELKKVLEIVRSNISPIKKGLDKINEPLVELQKFKHKFIPDYLSNKINKLGNKGIMINNAISKFFKTIDESNDIIIKPIKKALTREISSMLSSNISPFEFDQDGNNMERIKRDIDNGLGWRRINGKSSQNMAIKQYLDKYTSQHEWVSDLPLSEKFSDENKKMYPTPYLMYIHLLQTSQGKNNVVEALRGMMVHEPEHTNKLLQQALLTIWGGFKNDFLKIYNQYKDIIKKILYLIMDQILLLL